jgi:drug/metabolite transporter (DMT)-like permease
MRFMPKANKRLMVQSKKLRRLLRSFFVGQFRARQQLSVLITRRLRTTDSSAIMAYYSSLVYVGATAIMAPLTLAVGEVQAHPSVVFLFRAWSMPTLFDWAIMSGLGLVWASAMYLMARAYSLAQASVVAPFEYATLPINAIWGLLLWREVPTATT